MKEEWRFPPEAWIPLVAGLCWLWLAPLHGLVAFLLAVVPGCLMLAAGVAMLLWPGDRPISHFAALGGLAGVLLAVPAGFAVGALPAALLALLSAAGFLAGGHHSSRFEVPVEGVPPVRHGLALAAQVGVDEALLATMLLTAPLPGRGEYPRIDAEAAAARELFEARGWLEKPAEYHRRPPPLEDPRIRATRLGRIGYEHLSFASGYEPHPGEPGRERWLSYEANRTAHAWVLRHEGPPRPWLVCIHGYQMGNPWIDLGAFPPPWLHRRLGLNLIVPMLPLHGRRKVGRRSGDGFLSGDLLDTIHAETNAVWDLRRLVGWVRSQQAPAVGVMGYSLGGYNTALLASLEDDLDCAIAGIPATDFARLYFRHGPLLTLRDAQRRGMASCMKEIFRVISPLKIPPRLPRERRYIFAATADRLVPAKQARDLWQHWEKPAIEWYQGGHISFRAHPSVVRFISKALRDSLL